MVTEISAKGQRILCAAGPISLAEIEAFAPLENSICKHVVEMGAPLAVHDAYFHPLVKDSKAIEAYGVAAYLGAPIDLDGETRRALCAVDRRRRTWTTEEQGIICEIAEQIRSSFPG